MTEKLIGSQEHLSLQQRLKDFIVSNGGSIRFDRFMEESLYGQDDSYYQTRVNIDFQDNGGHWSTFAIRPLFSELVSRPIFKELAIYGKEAILLELGGGTGVFKSNILKLAEQQHLSFRYISVDNSFKLSIQQKKHDGEAYFASALDLPFPDRSLNGVIFMNELVDALPVRLLRAVKEKSVFSHFEELWYNLNGTDIEHKWLPAEDQQTNDYWSRQRKILTLTHGFSWDWDISNYKTMALNLLQADLIRECSRVLGKGKIIIIDYGDTIYNLLHNKEDWRVFASPSRINTSVEQLHEHAYFADLSSKVNFSDLQLVAEAEGLEVSWYGPQRYFIWEQVTKAEEDELKHLGDKHPWVSKINIPVLKTQDNTGTFKVLVLSRS